MCKQFWQINHDCTMYETAFYMRDYKGETIKLLPFYMTYFLFTEVQSYNIWRKYILNIPQIYPKITPDIPNYLHISDPNLLKYEFYHISNFITRFPWHFEINLYWLLLEDSFLQLTKKMHISEYVCKTCLKELGSLLKCWETFENFIAACNSSKNARLPRFFLQRFLTTAF